MSSNRLSNIFIQKRKTKKKLLMDAINCHNSMSEKNWKKKIFTAS